MLFIRCPRDTTELRSHHWTNMGMFALPCVHFSQVNMGMSSHAYSWMVQFGFHSNNE